MLSEASHKVAKWKKCSKYGQKKIHSWLWECFLSLFWEQLIVFWDNLELNLDEEYCTYLCIYSFGSLWLVAVVHVTQNSICSASARVPNSWSPRKAEKGWKEQKRFCMLSLYLSYLRLFFAKNIKLCSEVKSVNQYVGEELAILHLPKWVILCRLCSTQSCCNTSLFNPDLLPL